MKPLAVFRVHPATNVIWTGTMKKFILVTFGFLGFAFYEMSGGAEFKPASARLAGAAEAEEAQPVQTVAVGPSVQAPETKAFVDTNPPLNEVPTRVSLNLTTLREVIDEAEPTLVAAKAVDTVETTGAFGVPVNADANLSSADTPAIIPSLIVPDAGNAASQGAMIQNASLTTSDNGRDIRTVSGNTVNVRGGPGTDFGVVNRLNRGDAVVILQDNGAGWVLMRSMDDGQEGWMADFLLEG
jgi:hypothetical protein